MIELTMNIIVTNFVIKIKRSINPADGVCNCYICSGDGLYSNSHNIIKLIQWVTILFYRVLILNTF